jgi:hypothetical protein
MPSFMKGFFKGWGLSSLTLAPLAGTAVWFQGLHCVLVPVVFGLLTLSGAVATYLAYKR